LVIWFRTFVPRTAYINAYSLGGAAGLALAARLSEVESQIVLVLEVGGFPKDIKPYMTPGAGQQVLGKQLSRKIYKT
jgi:hypothetical protein